MRVDLPAPFGPTRAMRSPRSTMRSTEPEHDLVPEGLADALELQDHPARLGRVGELEADLLALGRDLDALDLVELLDPALHLPGLGGLVAEAVDEGLGLLDLLRLPAVRLAQAIHVRLVVDHVLRIVAVVVGEGAQAHLGDALDRGVEEVAVVGDEHHRARVVVEVLLEPVARGQVEVVGGLVHQQQVRAGEQELGQGDAHLPAARELLALALLVLQGEAQALQHVGHPGLHLLAARGP